MPNENDQNGAEPQGFAVPEGDLFLFVRVNPEKGDFQVLFRDPITARGLAEVALEYVRVQFEDALRAQSVGNRVAVPGLDLGSIARLRRKVGQG